MTDFSAEILKAIVLDLERSPQVLALWRAGSAATGTSDRHSDIDLCIVGSDSIPAVFEILEATLERVSQISHRALTKSFWPEYQQRVYFLKGAPPHFFVDAGVFLRESENVLHELTEVERHGTPQIHFDKAGLVQLRHTDPESLRRKQKLRVQEVSAMLPIYLTEVRKELERGNSIDAFAYYFGGLVRPLVDLLGILHRPYRYDFSLRYLHRDFPAADHQRIEHLSYVPSSSLLAQRVDEVERLTHDVLARVHATLGD